MIFIGPQWQWGLPDSVASEGWVVYALVLGPALAGVACFVMMVCKTHFLELDRLYDSAVFFFSLGVPCFYEVVNGHVSEFFKGTLLFSETGARIISLFTVVVVMSKGVWPGIEKLGRLLVPRERELRRIDREVASTLEKVVGESGTNDINADIIHALEAMNITRYAYYIRRGRDTFGLGPYEGWTGVPHELAVSGFLQGYLGLRKTVIDGKTLWMDWRMFFQSFELKRLERQIRYRFLLPVRLGESVRGILLIPQDGHPNPHPDGRMAERVNTVGLAVLTSGKGK